MSVRPMQQIVPAGRPPGRDDPDTVMTRLRAKQATFTRRTRRRQVAAARRAQKQELGGRRGFMAWLRDYKGPMPTVRVNPGRDYKSRRSGRLRKELR